MSFTPMAMEQVKSHIKEQLTSLGYYVTAGGRNHKDRMIANMDGSNQMEWTIRSGNLKRFEVEVAARYQDAFNTGHPHTSTIYNDEENSEWRAIGRFRKEFKGISEFVEWLSQIRKDHQHLLEALHPDQLPPPNQFAAGRFFDNGDYRQGGWIERAKVSTIVSIRGVDLIDAHDPNSKAWFLVQLQLSRGGAFICTDGDVWFPVVQGKVDNKDRFRVLSRHGMIKILSQMNQRDKELVHDTVQRYIETQIVPEQKE